MMRGRSAGPEAGQGTTEYAGVLFVVALIMALLFATPVGDAVALRARWAVCNATGGSGCGGEADGGPVAQAPPDESGDGGDQPVVTRLPSTGGGGGQSDEDEDDGGGFWGGVKDLGGAFVDGAVRGDFNRDDRTDDGWTEGFRSAGQILSGVLVVGDVRDAGAAGQRIWDSGGSDGWGDLIWSGVGVIPIGGDIAKGVRGGSRVADAVRAGDDVPRPRGAGAADDVPQRPTCLTNSFTPDTGVLLADGSTLPIAQVDVGDLMLAADPRTGEVGARPVTALIAGSGVKHLIDLTVAGATLTATGGHPFWVPETGAWVDAEDLRPGDALLTAAGERTEVLAVVERTTSATVHNLTVADLHTYHVLAGTEPVLVHNADCTPADLDDLVPQARRQHILDGDATGGGHRAGTGKPGKSEFPASWSDDQIIESIVDVATDPASTRVVQPNGRTRVTGTRDGIDIEVILERPNHPTNPGGVVTGYPTNTPRNPP